MQVTAVSALIFRAKNNQNGENLRGKKLKSSSYNCNNPKKSASERKKRKINIEIGRYIINYGNKLIMKHKHTVFLLKKLYTKHKADLTKEKSYNKVEE